MSRRSTLLGALLSVTLTASAQVRIRVVEGDGAINSIRFHRAHDPTVQVLDMSGQAVPGATVSFLLPATGPSATFEDKSLSLTVQTDARGMAASHGMRPNNIAGQFRLRVTASWRGEAASATIAQSNVEPVRASATGKRILIVGLIGGAVAGGVLAATHGGGAAATTPVAPTAAIGGTIVAGSPAIGPPH